jgi:hypothetical protein
MIGTHFSTVSQNNVVAVSFQSIGFLPYSSFPFLSITLAPLATARREAHLHQKIPYLPKEIKLVFRKSFPSLTMKTLHSTLGRWSLEVMVRGGVRPPVTRFLILSSASFTLSREVYCCESDFPRASEITCVVAHPST